MCNEHRARRYSGRRRMRVIDILRNKQGMFCCYCETPLVEINLDGIKYKDIPANSLTVEHLRRIEDGGTNQLDNLALACHSCNTGRGTVDWFTYKNYKMGELYVAP